MTDTESSVQISKEEHEKLLKARDMLDCLKGVGVDNWEGYDFAIKEYFKLHPEEA